MKPLFLIFIFLVYTETTFGQTTFSQPRDGTECSNLFFEALLQKDTRALAQLLAPDFLAIGFQGQNIPAQMLQQAVTDGLIVVDSGILSGTMTRSYGNVVLITGLWNVSARIQGASLQGELAYTNVCVNAGGRWKVVSFQLTPLR
jgi:ketosteroid isomerase-like protein